MSERGVFAVDRAIWDHDYLVDSAPFSRREAWLWLVSEAAWKPHRRRIAGNTFNLTRGQVAASTRFIASKWRWSEPKVRRFLKGLISEGMVDANTDAGMTVITVCNYDAYQKVSLPRDANRERDADAEVTHDRRKEESKEDREVNSDSGGGLFGDQPEGKKPRKNPWPRDYRDQFWNHFPLKVSKKAALEVLERIFEADKISFDDIVNGIDAYKRSKPPDRDWMHPTTFLRNERWNDEHGNFEARRTNGSRKPDGGETITAGVRAATDAILGRNRHGADFAEGFDPQRSGPGAHSERDLELPYRVVSPGARS